MCLYQLHFNYHHKARVFGYICNLELIGSGQATAGLNCSNDVMHGNLIVLILLTPSIGLCYFTVAPMWPKS